MELLSSIKQVAILSLSCDGASSKELEEKISKLGFLGSSRGNLDRQLDRLVVEKLIKRDGVRRLYRFTTTVKGKKSLAYWFKANATLEAATKKATD